MDTKQIIVEVVIAALVILIAVRNIDGIKGWFRKKPTANK